MNISLIGFFVGFLKLIYYTFFIGIQLLNNLYASPVYAAKWGKGKQVVLLYGDAHNTHKVFGKKEQHLADRFITTLSKAQNQTLLLTEDHYRPSSQININEKILTYHRDFENISFEEEEHNPFISIIN